MIIDKLQMVSYITTKDVAELLNVKERRSREILKHMTNNGIIMKEGVTNRVSYSLVKDE